MGDAFFGALPIGSALFILGERKMKREELEKFSLFSLRDLGRKIGVKRSSALSKKALIDEILSVESGIKKPYFNNKGRPAKTFNSINLQEVYQKAIEKAEYLKYKREEKENTLKKIYDTKRKVDELFNQLIKEICEKSIE